MRRIFSSMIVLFERAFARTGARIAAGGALTILFCLAEGDFDSLPFTFLIGALFAALVFALTLRPAFAVFVAMSLLSFSSVISMAKRKFLGMNAHVFDIWFYLAKPDTLAFLWDEYRMLVVIATSALAGFLAFATLVYRHSQKISGQRLYASGVTFGFVAAIPLVLPWEADNLSYHNRRYHFASSFFVSLSDIPRLLRPSPLSQRLAATSDILPFTQEPACKVDAGAPDIVLTLSESAVPPAQIPGWKFDASLQDYFKSSDNEIHRARAETHGGGTWVTHTSVVSGLSMADFGWMRPYATMLLRDRLHHGLAAALAKCGYKTVVISPQSYNFVNEGAMLTAMGFSDYIDRAQLDAPTKHEEDSFYFNKALDYYKKHAAQDGRPLFLFVFTMAAHSPYNFRFRPERLARGEPFGNDEETDEYLRRLTFAQEDYWAFTRELRAQKRPVLAAQFGDHHPLLTIDAFRKANQNEAMSDWRSRLFETFYAVTPLNFTPVVPMPNVPVLDFAYLGVTLLDMAGVPLDPVFAEKRELRALCEGAFHTCADRAAVDRHLARMQLSGYLREPGAPPKPAFVAASPAIAD